jgi:hypothetical protein
MDDRNPLDAGSLLDHARAAARSDEARHRMSRPSATTTQTNERTLLGWGGASLLDLEWTGRCQYSKVVNAEYRRAYAEEYQQCRAAHGHMEHAAPTALA